MTTTELPANPIRVAIELLKQYGWRQGNDGWLGVAMCGRGALIAAVGLDSRLGNHAYDPRFRLFLTAMLRVQQSIGQMTGVVLDVVTYNDRVCRTVDDLLKVMEHAAQRWDEELASVPRIAPPRVEPKPQPRFVPWVPDSVSAYRDFVIEIIPTGMFTADAKQVPLVGASS